MSIEPATRYAKYVAVLAGDIANILNEQTSEGRPGSQGGRVVTRKSVFSIWAAPIFRDLLSREP